MQYVSASSSGEAVELLTRAGGKGVIMAGGTDLMVEFKEGKICPECFIDVTKAADMAGISADGERLVIGGAASGKSEYAESLVLRSTLPRYYLATMQVWDAECAARVEKHRRMRAAKQFETVECPLHLDAVHLPARGTALLEDLGNLTANELYDPAGAGPQTAQAILSGLDAVYAQCETLIVVSNEVFSGGADYAGDTDRYLLALAQVNNALAARADAVVRVVCGIPVYYKGVEK